MNINTFAERHHLRTVRDGSGEDSEIVIPGRIGESTISQYSAAELCVSFVTDSKKAPRTGLFNTFNANCLQVGMTPRQVGNAEGIFSFNPSDSAQAKVAIRGIRANAKRRINSEQALAAAARLAVARQARHSA